MRRCLLVVALALAGSALPGGAAAQGPSPEQAVARLRLDGTPAPAARSSPAPRSPAPSRHLVALPDRVVPKRKQHTVTGLLIGAGLGFAAGWGFYNAMCEAVDNRCAGSRVQTALFGTAAGGSLGGLVGSLAD
jgi:hypothetical protein